MPEGEPAEVLEEFEEGERRKEVVGVFKEFGLTFEIENHPDLLQRLVDTREHF